MLLYYLFERFSRGLRFIGKNIRIAYRAAPYGYARATVLGDFGYRVLAAGDIAVAYNGNGYGSCNPRYFVPVGNAAAPASCIFAANSGAFLFSS